ncbi:MAG: transposase [Clostridium sp.]
MPREERKLSEFGIYHIVVKGHNNSDIFKSSNDKLTYLRIIKFYQNIFEFKIYAYCVMNNHVHFIIHVIQGSLSIIMKKINQTYSDYFKDINPSVGTIFKSRFYSSVISNDDYLIQAINYIHKNPTDIEVFKETPEKYPFSSLGVYVKVRKDYLNILEVNKVLQYFSNDLDRAIELYRKALIKENNIYEIKT